MTTIGIIPSTISHKHTTKTMTRYDTKRSFFFFSWRNQTKETHSVTDPPLFLHVAKEETRVIMIKSNSVVLYTFTLIIVSSLSAIIIIIKQRATTSTSTHSLVNWVDTGLFTRPGICMGVYILEVYLSSLRYQNPTILLRPIRFVYTRIFVAQSFNPRGRTFSDRPNAHYSVIIPAIVRA